MRTTKVIFVDDIDGSEDDVRSVTFGLDGREYEIDLSATNATALEEALAPYRDAARVVTGSRRKRKAKAA